ncbi:B12-binding domain-containing radical SAM protein, partial [Candidatus Fermentibacteria bacterium]|nr:B12-binding domain-containing radical SAM protein [Candidatus Fermentibacteria bacterium]
MSIQRIKASARVVFIEPRAPDCHIFSLYPLPRLGTVILATMLEREGFATEVLFEQIEPVGVERIAAADVVGITATTSTAPRAYGFADLARRLGKPVVMGGPHVTYAPQEALEHANCVVLGEAERIAPELFQRLAVGEPVDDIPGVLTAGSQSPQRAPHPSSLDDLPIPDLGLVRGFDLKRRVLRFSIAPVEASRGCPHDCSFCCVTGMFGRRFRFRSVERVMEELRIHYERKRSVFFYDDNLAANTRWFTDLLERIAAELPGLTWSAQVRVEVARDHALLSLMRRAGCITVFAGIESVNPETLDAMNKHQSAEEIRDAMVQFRRHRIPVHGMFILGMDTDTPDSIRSTVKWAKRAGVSSAQFLILAPFPGTRVYDELKQQGRILFTDWSLYDGHHVTFQPARMTPAELQSLQLEAHDSFYSRRRACA